MTEPSRNLPPITVTDLLLDTSPYLSCDDCFDQIDTYVERRLADPRHQDVQMQVHLAACGACAEEADALMELLANEPR